MYRRLILVLALLPLVGATDLGRASSSEHNVDIVAIDLAGHQTNLTRNLAWDVNPTVARDGRIAFFSNRGGGGDLYVMDANGRNVRRITNGAVDDSGILLAEDLDWSQAAWSPRGDEIAFDGEYTAVPPPCPQHCAGWAVRAIGSDGSGLKQIALNARTPAWSPDGRRVAYESGAGGPDLGGASGVTIARVDGSDSLQVPVLNQFNTVGPVWSPGGGELAFQGQRADGGAFSIYVVHADGKRKRRLASGQDPSWSPNGRRLAFIDNCRLLTIGTNGKGKRQLSRNGDSVIAQAWAPKGNLIAYIAGTSPSRCGGGSPASLRVQTVTGDGKRVRILARESALSTIFGSPVWNPSGTRILVAVEPH